MNLVQAKYFEKERIRYNYLASDWVIDSWKSQPLTTNKEMLIRNAILFSCQEAEDFCQHEKDGGLLLSVTVIQIRWEL